MVLPVPVGNTSKGRCTPRAVAASRAATASYWYGRGVSRNVVGGWAIASIPCAPRLIMMGIDTPCVRAPSTRTLQVSLRRGPRATGGRRLWTTLGVKGHRPLVGNRDGHDVLDVFFAKPVYYTGFSMPAL